jgi:serine/threonine protein kinase/Tol biopolymer transport system component
VRWHGDVVGADGFRLGRFEEGAGDDVDGIGVGSELTDGMFELLPASAVEGLGLRGGVGEEEGGAEGYGREGEVAGGNQMAARITAVGVVGVGGGGEGVVGTEVAEAGERGFGELGRGEFIGCPGGDLAAGVETEDEGWAIREGAVAGGEGEAIGLGREDLGDEDEEQQQHILYIGCLKHFFIDMFWMKLGSVRDILGGLMTLSAGMRLGPYEILAPLGAGGMGEVWKARDGRLGRDVALKVLPAGRDVRRFEQEARAIAALNHPNIVAIYDVGEQDGLHFLVQELVDGQSLREILEGGALPVRKAMDLGAQVADGLAAAHALTIVHRDLKPDNIMVTREGRAKILDFGLAKQVEAVAPDGATRKQALTQDGVVMGTIGYMAPEQVRGQPAEIRSDIFAFGSVLYEMVSGVRAFGGDSMAEVMSAILKEDPAALGERVPRHLQDVVLRCLEKEPGSRFQSAKDLAFALRADRTTATVVAPAERPRRNWKLALGMVAGVLLSFWGGAWWVYEPVLELENLRTRQVVGSPAEENGPAWAPDGKGFSYASTMGRETEIYYKALDAAEPTLLVPASAKVWAIDTFFSKDGSKVYFTGMKDGKRMLGAVNRAGGAMEVVLDDLGGFLAMNGVVLTPDGKSLVVVKVAGDGGPALWTSTPPGGAPVKLEGAPVMDPAVGRCYLRFSPDGKKLLATTSGSGTAGQSWEMDWPHGKATPVLAGVFRSGTTVRGVTYFPDGKHLAVNLEEEDEKLALWVVEERTGRSVRSGLEAHTSSIAGDGRMVYSSWTREHDLVELPLDGGAPRSLLATNHRESYPEWSPRGDSYLYVTTQGGTEEYWLGARAGKTRQRILAQAGVAQAERSLFGAPSFSPDGKRFAFASGRRVYVAPLEGGTAIAVTEPQPDGVRGASWSPDGKRIVFRRVLSLHSVEVGGDGISKKICDCEFLTRPQWSPDGKWIAGVTKGGRVTLVEAESGKLRDLGGHAGVSFGGVGWSKDGKTIYVTTHRDGREGLAAVDAQTGGRRTIATYEAGYLFGTTINGNSALSLSPDGKSVAVTRMTGVGDIWLAEGLRPPRSLWERMMRVH